jgi:serine/threonine protein kinase
VRNTSYTSLKLSEHAAAAPSTNCCTSDKEKLVRYLTSYWARFNEPPPTTVNFYRLGRMIGKGAFGNVCLLTHKLTGASVAAKIIEKSYMKDDYRRKKVRNEILILQRMAHSNVVRILEVFESAKQLFIVTEFCGGGDLL